MSRPAIPAVLRSLIGKLHPGFALGRRGGVLDALLAAIAAPVADAEASAEALMNEVDPRSAIQLLPDFERVLGPDPCGRDGPRLTLRERQKLTHQRWTSTGGQSRAYFVTVAALLGYEITIIEHYPFVAGISRVGDPAWQIGDSSIRFVWLVRLTNIERVWFRAGGGRAGVDPHLNFPRADDLECVLQRLKPAHTTLVFQYAVGQVLLATENGELIADETGAVIAWDWP